MKSVLRFLSDEKNIIYVALSNIREYVDELQTRLNTTKLELYEIPLKRVITPTLHVANWEGEA